MALTRSMLKAYGLEPEKIDEIIAAHTETVTGLKDEIDSGKEKIQELTAKVQSIPELEKKIKELEADAEKAKGKDYDALKKEFDDYKAEQKKLAVHGQKVEAQKALMKDAGIPEKHWDKIIKYSDVDSIELDDDGKITKECAKARMKELKDDWGDHVEKTDTTGADTKTPPKTGGKTGMTREQIDAIKDTAERQKAILENHELFGF